MKKLVLIALIAFSSISYSQIVDTRWQYNMGTCRAQTVCPNGTPIWCQAVAFNYGNAPATLNNSCRTRVVPGALVHCQGFADQVDAFGRLVFVPVNLPVSCY